MKTDEQVQAKTKPDELGWWWVWHGEAWWPCHVMGDGSDPHFWKRVIFGATWGPTLHEQYPSMLWFRAQLPAKPVVQTTATDEWHGHFLRLNEAERQASWPEDFAKDADNGAYLNVCGRCQGNFVGHKRRIICQTCEDQRQSTARGKISAMQAVERISDRPDTT